MMVRFAVFADQFRILRVEHARHDGRNGNRKNERAAAGEGSNDFFGNKLSVERCPEWKIGVDRENQKEWKRGAGIRKDERVDERSDVLTSDRNAVRVEFFKAEPRIRFLILQSRRFGLL